MVTHKVSAWVFLRFPKRYFTHLLFWKPFSFIQNNFVFLISKTYHYVFIFGESASLTNEGGLFGGQSRYGMFRGVELDAESSAELRGCISSGLVEEVVLLLRLHRLPLGSLHDFVRGKLRIIHLGRVASLETYVQGSWYKRYPVYNSEC